MFGIDSGELIIIALVALVVIGPKDLPRAMRTLGNFVGRARGMARHFRTGFDAMIREVELEDMEKQWRADNERIMRDHPVAPPESEWGKPPPAAAPPAPAPDAAAPPPIPPAGAAAPPSGGSN